MLVRRLAACCLGWLALTGSARAYCRSHTKDPAASTCPDACQNVGQPFAWRTSSLTYAFNVRGFPDLADAELRRMIADSIAPWEAVTCKGESIGIHSVADAQPTELGLGPMEDEPNENVIVYFSQAEWEENDLGNAAYATTLVWFDSDTGEILGADMMFNDSMGPFGECADSGCGTDGPRADLRNVATHEFGHFLGLAHSDVDGSTMYCNASPREIMKRTLAPDDIEGLCAIYPPGEPFEPPANGVFGVGCALGVEPSGGWLLLLGLLLRRRLVA
jgi:hypothetical protein